MKKQNIPKWFLSSEDERKLSREDKQKYIKKLQNYCIERTPVNITIGAMVIGPKLKRFTNYIAKKLCNILEGNEVKIVTDGIQNIPQEPVIFACTHQGVLDNFVWIINCPRHALVVHSVEVSKALLLAQLNTGLILVTKKKENRISRINSKLDMMTTLLKGHSIIIFPETTWNLSPNLLHLPFNYGFLDVAQKTGKTVVPMVIEYTYDTSRPIERVTNVHIQYGETIVVGENDNILDKLEEYKEKISTMRWNLIEEKGIFKRESISNMDYINYVKGNIKNLKMGKIDINIERVGIQGQEQDFYKFQHINDVSWDEWGELRQTDEVERLKQINRRHKI